jgi:hypothetical protein
VGVDRRGRRGSRSHGRLAIQPAIRPTIATVPRLECRRADAVAAPLDSYKNIAQLPFDSYSNRCRSPIVAGRPPRDALRGSLDVLVLENLSLVPIHGWGINQRVQQISEGVLESIRVRSTPPFSAWRRKG